MSSVNAFTEHRKGKFQSHVARIVEISDIFVIVLFESVWKWMSTDRIEQTYLPE